MGRTFPHLPSLAGLRQSAKNWKRQLLSQQWREGCSQHVATQNATIPRSYPRIKKPTSCMASKNVRKLCRLRLHWEAQLAGGLLDDVSERAKTLGEQATDSTTRTNLLDRIVNNEQGGGTSDQEWYQNFEDSTQRTREGKWWTCPQLSTWPTRTNKLSRPWIRTTRSASMQTKKAMFWKE